MRGRGGELHIPLENNEYGLISQVRDATMALGLVQGRPNTALCSRNTNALWGRGGGEARGGGMANLQAIPVHNGKAACFESSLLSIKVDQLVIRDRACKK